MKFFILLLLALLFTTSVFAFIDYKCMKQCTDNGNAYQLCRHQCEDGLK